jgi:hypothetical protein
LALGLLLVVAVLMALVWKQSPPPQIITLPTGERYQFFAAAWSTNQEAPTFSERLVEHVPRPMADYLRRKWSTQLGIAPLRMPSRSLKWVPGVPPKPPEPSLHCWFRWVGTPSFPQQTILAFLSDENGAVGQMQWAGNAGVPWLHPTFAVVPRRSARLTLHCFDLGRNQEVGHVTFRNPAFKRFPQWDPEPLPAVKRAGDLEVRLVDFVTAEPYLGNPIEALFSVEMQSLRGTNEGWGLYSAELSDAMGHCTRENYYSTRVDTHRCRILPVPWAGEPAWRLKLELDQYRGHASQEVVTFKNVPVQLVGARSTALVTNHTFGVPLVLKQTVQRRPNRTDAPPQGYGSWTQFTVELPDKPAGVMVNFVEMTGDTGWKLAEGETYQINRSRDLFVRVIPTNVATVNITWAVQKLRTVEFLVRPPKPERRSATN